MKLSDLQLQYKKDPATNGNGYFFTINNRFKGVTFDKVIYFVTDTATNKRVSYLDDVLEQLLQQDFFNSGNELPDARSKFAEMKSSDFSFDSVNWYVIGGIALIVFLFILD